MNKPLYIMDYIYTSSSLSNELCSDIIEKYKNENGNHYEGVMGGGLDKNVKDTRDFVIPANDLWESINDTLSYELHKNLKTYIQKINDKPNFHKEENYGMDFKHFPEKLYQSYHYMIHKYSKQIGKYVYHDDSTFETDKTRVIAFIWYLNEVEEGGETEFFGGSFRVKPETGKLLLFPSVWTFPHRGNIPISSDKYIITGWLYLEHSKNREIPRIVSKTDPCLGPALKDTDDKRLIFDFFYSKHRGLFQDYKNKVSFPELKILLYTPIVCEWLIEQFEDTNPCTKIEDYPDTIPFILSMLNIHTDTIKRLYKIEPNFDIKEWYVVRDANIRLDLDYDLCIQTDLYTGLSYVGPTFNKLNTSCQLVQFVEFTFQYVDTQNEKKVLTMKQIVDPCLELL